MVKTQQATFGMGCFWQPDLLFSKLPGVLSVKVGYMGGDEKKFPKPSYEQVCSDETGYVEVVHIEFTGKYDSILDTFWNNHNPTTLNRQGPDIGNQYKSVIFYYDMEQKKLAESSMKKAQKKWDKPIVTEIRKSSTFFPAEEYHQKYLEKRGMTRCHF